MLYLSTVRSMLYQIRSMLPWEGDHHITYALVSIIFFALVFKLRRSRYSKLNLPPSPWRLPIIGNLHQLGFLPHHNLRSLSKKHGSLMFLQFGQASYLIVSSADAAKEIFKTQDLNFSSRPKLRVGEELFYSFKDVAMCPYGDYWKQVRKITVMELLSVKRTESFKSVRKEEADIMVTRIHESCISSSPIVNLCDILTSHSVNVICRVALGRKFEGDGSGRNFSNMIRDVLHLTGAFNVGDFIPWLTWVNHLNGYNAMFRRTFKEINSFLESVIEEHSHRSSGDGVEDFVDVLLRIEQDESIIGATFTRDNIKAIILDIFIAGTDTTSTTLVWAMTELIGHREIYEKVQREVREIGKGKPYITEDDVEQMHYMKMVIKETLRLHPPGPLLFPRESSEPTKIFEYDIPANTRVITNAWAIGRDPLIWDDPESFVPERFANNYDNYRGVGFEFIPFGGGRRICPGMGLSKPIMEFPFANLLFHFDWSLPPGTSLDNLDVTEGFGAVAYKKMPLLLVPTLPSYQK